MSSRAGRTASRPRGPPAWREQVRSTAAEPGTPQNPLQPVCPSISHRNREQRKSENKADPETARHVAQFRILLFFGRDGPRLERHAADRARSGLGRMISGCIGQVYSVRVAGSGISRLQGHAAGGACTGLRLAHLGAHRANVGCGGASGSAFGRLGRTSAIANWAPPPWAGLPAGGTAGFGPACQASRGQPKPYSEKLLDWP